MRKLPGTIKVEGRKFLYLQFLDVKHFEKSFDDIGTVGSSELPKSGGIISENTIIQLPNNGRMFGVSYKGDLDGWENSILGYCAYSNLTYGEIVLDSLVLSNGQIIPLSDCKVSFY